MDGIVDCLDLDSDNDGCFDAIEGDGSFDYPDLVANNSLDNDGSSVDADGIPTATGSPQGAGSSLDAATQATECDVCTNTNHPDYSAFSASAAEDSPESCAGNDGSATITAVGGTTGYTYLWDNGEATQTAISLAQGTHSFTVTDVKAVQQVLPS